MTLQKAFLAIFIVLFVHGIAIVFSLYGILKWFDIPMHFAGGLAIGLLALAIWQQGVADVKFKGWFARQLEWWIVPLFLVGFVSFVSIGWEIYEFIMDQWFTDVINGMYRISRQPSVADTMLDFTMDILGGLIALIFYRKR